MRCKKVLACLFSASILATMGVAVQAIDYKPLKKSQIETAAVKLYKAAKKVWAKATAQKDPFGDGRALSELGVGDDVDFLIKKYAVPHYADKPKVVDSASFEKLDGIKWYRGIQPEKTEAGDVIPASTFFKQLKKGDFYTGVNGNGPYAGDSINIAKKYAKGGGLVCRFVYDSTAKVISRKDIEKILKKYFENHPEYKDADSDAEHKFFCAQETALGTDGFVGRLLGYDVILCNNSETGEIHACAVLNRGVLTIDSKKCEIKKSKTKKWATKKEKSPKTGTDA